MRLFTAFFCIILLGVAPVAMGQDAPEDRVALTHQVVEVIDGKTLTLNDGQSIRLAGVDAPNLAWDADEEPDPLAEEAKAALEQLAKGQSVRFALTEDELDRKGRLVGVVYTASGTSLQQAI
ncbi:MAG: thermonuclease family protein [Rickettsiales bacterium]